MQIILLSGGSGKRLWPLSNNIRSKQFLKILDSEDGDKESMLQRVWRQLKQANLAGSTIIATSSAQKEIIQRQIGEKVPMITEPTRRDTFAAIALSISYLYNIKNVSKNEAIVILPVDPYVDQNFFETIKDLEEEIEASNNDLTLVGVQPTYPSEKYGYIIPEKLIDDQKKLYEVKTFKEKPNEEQAQKLIANNALWNCGVFGFRLNYILEILSNFDLPVDYDYLQKNYDSVPKISFDYKVVENANNIIMKKYTGEWKDLGTWNTLTEEMASNKIGKGLISKDSINTHLINELDIPVTVIGVENLIIASSPDGIIVSDKASSPQIKELTEDYEELQRYEERIWGWSRILDYAKYENEEEMVTKRIMIEKNKNSTYHFHNHRDEVWTIVSGKGEVVLDGQLCNVKAGDIIHIPVNKPHGVKAIENLEIIEVQTGVEISNEDFTRLSYSWKNTVNKLVNYNRSN